MDNITIRNILDVNRRSPVHRYGGMAMRWCLSAKLVLAVMILPLLAGNAEAKRQYQVQRGDTLASIAASKGTTTDILKEINHLKSNIIKPKQILTLPEHENTRETQSAASPEKPDFYVVKKGDTLSSIASKTGCALSTLTRINQLSSKRLKIGQKLAIREKTVPEVQTVPNVPDTPAIDQPAAVNDNPDTNISLEKKKLLGSWENPKEPHLLVNVALAFLGAPYRLGGSSVRGIDCSGFVKKIYALFDVDLPRTAAEQSRVGVEVARDDLAEGDLIFFRTGGKGIGHVGIYIGDNKFVHAASGTKKVRVDSLDTSYFNKRYKRAVRLKALETPPASESTFIMTKGGGRPGA